MHLGLVVPDGDCGLAVGDDERRWVEGQVFAFNDLALHEVSGVCCFVRRLISLLLLATGCAQLLVFFFRFDALENNKTKRLGI